MLAAAVLEQLVVVVLARYGDLQQELDQDEFDGINMLNETTKGYGRNRTCDLVTASLVFYLLTHQKNGTRSIMYLHLRDALDELLAPA
ncbi:hypothetical protein EVAR_101478_1 [Eumeta japonica]|uniref:Uncharacterized protein n=1 Tax=Eumeta variegata TaxID=151549 RepID=A0A4C1T4U3_EUMVA|nr:hypothetical protein EVAR_101478_1 [Eumeta japonica]